MKILLSIRPEYAYKILDGSKRYEFRRRIHRDERVTGVLIYATLPVGKVIGEFSINRIHTEHPRNLWKRTRAHSGISESFFSEYFLGRDVGHAIEVQAARTYKRPKELKEILPSGVPPQSFAYVR